MTNEVLKIYAQINEINKKILNNTELNTEEKEIYCLSELINRKDYNKLSCICEDYKFLLLYQIYFKDLSFKSNYFHQKIGLDLKSCYEKLKLEDQNNSIQNEKFNEENNHGFIEKTIELGFLIPVSPEQIKKDKKYFEQVSFDWQQTINITNHSNQKLKDTSEETREIIREVKKKLKRNSATEDQINEEIKKVLWKSKYIHYESLKISEEIEKENKFPFQLYLNGKSLFFTFRTLIHILNRHYGYLPSNEIYKTNKSYHNPIFYPEKIHTILKEIFKKLNKSREFKDEPIIINNAYNVCFKSINYQFYLTEFDNKKLRISSIYPIENESEKKKLNKKTLIKIDSQLSFYKNGS